MSATPKPRYQQVKELIIGQISRGELGPHDRVLSENELVETMHVSRMTANRALRELTDEGYVERVAGRGTFVADFRARSHALEVHDIAEEIQNRGHAHSAEVIGHSRQHACGEIAQALHIGQGGAIFHLLLVHYEDRTPIQVEDRYVLADFAPDCLEQNFAATTPSKYLSALSPLQEAEQVVRAALPNCATRERLQMRRGEPSLVVLQRTWSEGRPVSFARLHHPGSRYELTGRYTPPGTPPSNRADITELENIPQ
jgi:GntR family histidine utilization transcriptional repressor